VLQECQQPDGVFVGGALGVGADAPGASPTAGVVGAVVVHREDDVGVAGIYYEKHGGLGSANDRSLSRLAGLGCDCLIKKKGILAADERRWTLMSQ
jgi:hypothetical protein